MKRIISILLITLFTSASFSVIACPKGQHPYGGTGSHHKGGYCSY